MVLGWLDFSGWWRGTTTISLGFSWRLCNKTKESWIQMLSIGKHWLQGCSSRRESNKSCLSQTNALQVRKKKTSLEKVLVVKSQKNHMLKNIQGRKNKTIQQQCVLQEALSMKEISYQKKSQSTLQLDTDKSFTKRASWFKDDSIRIVALRRQMINSFMTNQIHTYQAIYPFNHVRQTESDIFLNLMTLKSRKNS